jgi:CHASE3 domain sensor protein
MFRNLKLGMKLGIGFALVLALLIGISTISILRITNISSAMTDIIDRRVPEVKLSNEVLENMMLVRISLRNVLLSSDKNYIQGQIDVLNEAKRKNSEVFDQLKPMIHTEGTKALFEKMGEARKNYVAAVNTFLPLADISSAQYDEVKAKQYLFGDYAKATSEFTTQIKNFIASVSNDIEKSGKEAEDLGSAAKSLVLTISIAAIILTILFAWWITRMYGANSKEMSSRDKFTYFAFAGLGTDGALELQRLPEGTDARQLFAAGGWIPPDIVDLVDRINHAGSSELEGVPPVERLDNEFNTLMMECANGFGMGIGNWQKEQLFFNILASWPMLAPLHTAFLALREKHAQMVAERRAASLEKRKARLDEVLVEMRADKLEITSINAAVRIQGIALTAEEKIPHKVKDLAKRLRKDFSHYFPAEIS